MPKAPAKPSAQKKPAKPSSRSKTGNSACSQAASNWQLAIRGKAPLDPDTYKTLGKCRAMSRAAKSADGRAAAGYNLSEQGRDAIKGRLQKRFDQGLITQKSRQDRLKTLLAQRKEKQATAATAKTGGDSNQKSLEVPQKNRLKNEITGPSGAKITGYNWSSHLEERYSQREDGLVLKRVSNWDGATKSEGTGRSIVHSFYVTRPDGRVTVEGIGSAQKILGISETRLKTIAKNEADAQRYRQQQDISEVKRREAIAQPSYGEANRDLRIRLGNAPGAEQFYNDSTTYRKDGKFLRVKNTLSDAMRERGWQPYNRPERSSKASQLLAQRKEKQATAAPVPAPAKQEFKPGWGNVVKADDQVARITSTGLFSDRVKLYRGRNTDTYRFMGFTDRMKLTEPTRSEKAAFLIKERSERPITEDQHKRAMKIVRKVTKPVSKSPKSINPNKINYTQENHAPSGFLEAIAPNGDKIRLRHVSGIYKATIHTRNNGVIKTIAEKNGLKNRTEAKKWVENHYASQGSTGAGGELIESAPAPAPAKFSRGGQLAPGRGTEYRKARAKSYLEERKNLQAAKKTLAEATQERDLPWMSQGIELTGDPNFRPQIPMPTARFTAARNQKAEELRRQRFERLGKGFELKRKPLKGGRKTASRKIAKDFRLDLTNTPSKQK